MGFPQSPTCSKFLKRIMFCRKSTNNVVCFELGRCPMYIQRKLRILKCWCSLLKTDNCILQACYKQLFCEYEKQQGNCINWVSKVRNELQCIFFGPWAILGTTRSLRCQAFFIPCGTAS